MRTAVAIAIGVAGALAAQPHPLLEGSAGNVCPKGVNTACPPDTACCPIFMSQSGYGCCTLGADAVCCPASSTVQGCCPGGTTCVETAPYSAVCVPNNKKAANISASQTCTPGAQFPPSATLPSVITIGDSVSEGYEPVLAANLSSVAFVQHSPWSVGGGADDVNNGLNCERFFLRTAMYEEAQWTLISFNFGLHDLNNASASEQEYGIALANFTANLPRTSKLVYITTTPFMPDRFFGNTVVEDLNAIAVGIMKAAGIPVIDLYSHITAYCGMVYSSCDICDAEPNAWPPGSPSGAHCGYHYTPAGYEYMMSLLVPSFKALLGL